MTLLIIFLSITAVAAIVMTVKYVGMRERANRLAATRDAESNAWQQRLDDLRRACDERIAAEREATGDRFKALAAEVLAANSRSLDDHTRLSLEAVLGPMKATLEGFTRDFKDCYSAEQTERLSLREGIEGLMRLNLRVSDETRNLAQALRGNNSFQGNWGEMVLKNILEHSGLEAGRWLVLQETSTDDEGDRLRPDAIINCPGDRRIIIDAKTSLTSYLRLDSAHDDDERRELVKAHAASIDKHVKQLRNKAYQDKIGLNKSDFMLMFVPHEGAFLAAMSANPDLWQSAFDSRVIIASPTHLVTVVKLVEQLWRTDDRNVNARHIADEAGAMLDKLALFLDDLDKVGTALSRARDAYDGAVNKLATGRGNILGRTDRIKSLGVKLSKQVPGRFAEHDEA